MRLYKVVSDSSRVYQPNTIISSDKLIDDFLNKCYNTEDAEFLGWLNTLKEYDTDDSVSQAIEVICDAWDMQLDDLTIMK